MVIGLEMLSDLGIEPSIVQHPRGDQRSFLRTAFTIQAVRGVILFGLAWAASPVVVWLAADPEIDIARLVPLAALSAIMLGITPTKVWLLHRRLQMRELAILEAVSFFAAMIVMCTLAFFFPAAWVLIFGGVFRSVVTVFLGYVWIEGPLDGPEWDPEAARDIIHFGKWIFVSTLVTFLAEKMTILVLPRLTDLNVLGVFAQGNKFAALFTVAVGPVVGQVMLPALAEAARVSRQDLKTGFRGGPRDDPSLF